MGENGETYNINADLVASRVAGALSSGRLIYLTDVDGVKDVAGELITSIDARTIKQMIDDKTILAKDDVKDSIRAGSSAQKRCEKSADHQRHQTPRLAAGAFYGQGYRHGSNGNLTGRPKKK
ncbi:MAG: hypothetical protein R2874_17125 [Desulfobacterales bacterium]